MHSVEYELNGIIALQSVLPNILPGFVLTAASAL